MSILDAIATNFSGVSAGILIALLPILVVYAFLQRFIVAGLSAAP